MPKDPYAPPPVTCPRSLPSQQVFSHQAVHDTPLQLDQQAPPHAMQAPPHATPFHLNQQATPFHLDQHRATPLHLDQQALPHATPLQLDKQATLHSSVSSQEQVTPHPPSGPSHATPIPRPRPHHNNSSNRVPAPSHSMFQPGPFQAYPHAPQWAPYHPPQWQPHPQMVYPAMQLYPAPLAWQHKQQQQLNEGYVGHTPLGGSVQSDAPSAPPGYALQHSRPVPSHTPHFEGETGRDASSQLWDSAPPGHTQLANHTPVCYSAVPSSALASRVGLSAGSTQCDGAGNGTEKDAELEGDGTTAALDMLDDISTSSEDEAMTAGGSDAHGSTLEQLLQKK